MSMGNENFSGGNRSRAFQQLAVKLASGEVVTPPALLAGEQRRLYVRATLLEDHKIRIKDRPDAAQMKFDRLTTSPFVFFRGTALLFYRDYAGMDSQFPTVLCIGDVHPENFGVMPNVDGEPFFGPNDFDEACFAPFSWDVKRGAVGFNLVAHQNGLRKKHRRSVVRCFLMGYLNALQNFSDSDSEMHHQFREHNSPAVIRKLIKSARKARAELLEKYVDLQRGEFKQTAKLDPRPDLVADLQMAMASYRREQRLDYARSKGHYTIKSVAIKHGSGTASLGLDRYFVLLEGPSVSHKDDIVLEVKQARESALQGLAPNSTALGKNVAQRIVQSHDVHVVGGDPYFGHLSYDNRYFLIRERSPFKNSVDVQHLNVKSLREYAHVCGAALAQAHARSDQDTGVTTAANIEREILDMLDGSDFVADILRFTKAATDRVHRDYALFKKDYRLGVYNFSPAAKKQDR